MKEKVEAVLAQVRPALQADGGDVVLVDVNEGIVKLKLEGIISLTSTFSNSTSPLF